MARRWKLVLRSRLRAWRLSVGMTGSCSRIIWWMSCLVRLWLLASRARARRRRLGFVIWGWFRGRGLLICLRPGGFLLVGVRFGLGKHMVVGTDGKGLQIYIHTTNFLAGMLHRDARHQ